MMQDLLVGLVSVSDRASLGVYDDKGIPALKECWAPPFQLHGAQKPGSSRMSKP